jgi:TP901 family phage tail tape measure protein
MPSRRIEVEIVGDASNLTRTFGRASKSAEGFAGRVGRSSRRVAAGIAGIGAAAVGLGAVTGKSFSSFEESLDRIVGLAGGSREQVEQFSRQILKLAPEVAKSPQELADALYFVASAGIAVSDQMAVVTASAKASAAGLGETQTVADAVTSAMNAYGAANLNAQQATDVLVATVREGKGEAAAFAPVIGTVAGFASQLGVAFSDVGAALAAMTRLGVPAETAAIQLQAVFSALVKTTPKAEKAFRKVGLTSAGLRKELKQKGLLATLQTLKAAFGDNTAAMAQAFPNIRALRGLFALVGKSSAQVRGIFDRMKNSTGALATAFGAVSKGEAFRFKQAMAALAVVGIRLGAVFAPVAKIIARGATRALGAIGDLIDRLGQAKTVRAKLDVIWEGVTDAARGAASVLGQAISRIDWGAVWAKARGIADGLQAQLEKVDFGFVGRRIGEGIASAVKVAIPAAKELSERINKALRTIDFEALGKALGPGLAAAIVTAFVTLSDPAFWIRNWDLALAVAATVFRARILAFGAKLVAPLARLGGSIVLNIAAAIERTAPRLAQALVAALLRLPALAARALAPLTNLVSAIFGRLGRIAQFGVRVLGIQIAINAVLGFASAVTGIFTRLAQAIPNLLSGMWQRLKEGALRAALAVVEPFSHLPRRFGQWARDLKDQWNAQLDGMQTHAVTTSAAIQDSVDRIEGKTVQVKVDTVDAAGRAAQPRRVTDAHERAAPATARQQRETGRTAAKEAQKTAEARAAAVTTSATAAAKATETAAERARAAAAKAEKARQKQREAFQRLLDSLNLNLEKAQTTAKLSDDLASLRKIEGAIQAQIKVEGKTVDLQRQLFQVRQQIAETQAKARQAKQFSLLGLGPEGAPKVPGVKALRAQLGRISEAIKGTFLDTGKTKGVLANIRKLLSGGLGALSADVRAKIAEILSGVDQKLSEGAKGAQTKFRKQSVNTLLAGLGLTAEQIREIRARLSGVGANLTGPGSRRGQVGAFGFAVPATAQVGAGGGGGDIVIHHTSHLDGRVVERSTTRHQQRRRRRNPPQKRGPLGGR